MFIFLRTTKSTTREEEPGRRLFISIEVFLRRPKKKTKRNPKRKLWGLHIFKCGFDKTGACFVYVIDAC